MKNSATWWMMRESETNKEKLSGYHFRFEIEQAKLKVIEEEISIEETQFLLSITWLQGSSQLFVPSREVAANSLKIEEQELSDEKGASFDQLRFTRAPFLSEFVPYYKNLSRAHYTAAVYKISKIHYPKLTSETKDH